MRSARAAWLHSAANRAKALIQRDEIKRLCGGFMFSSEAIDLQRMQTDVLAAHVFLHLQRTYAGRG